MRPPIARLLWIAPTVAVVAALAVSAMCASMAASAIVRAVRGLTIRTGDPLH